MKMELRRRSLDKIFKRRDRIDMPEFQRDEVWTMDKKKKLIDTILRGWHLPKLYFRVIDNSAYECVDGQQRLVAIWEFYDNKFPLDDSVAKEFGGKYYKDLPDEVTDTFDDFELEIDEIEDASDEDLQELFSRLQLGTPLNTPEKLNAIGGEMRNFCKWVASQSFFEKKVALKNTRFAHFNIVTTWMLIEARGIQPQVRFAQLDSFLRENRKFSEESDLAKRIKAALHYLDLAFPNRSDKLRLRANVLSVCMLASKVVAYRIPLSTARKFGDFVERFFSELAIEVEKGAQSTRSEMRNYQDAISYGSADGLSIKTRIDILTRGLATAHQEFAPLLVFDTDSQVMHEPLRQQQKVIIQLLKTVNDQYSADHGEDMFKLTNESLAAIEVLPIPCDSSDQYGELIDSLYKLVYEGSGACKRLPAPVPDFPIDVKHLRTGLRHDVDHGEEKDIAKKRKLIGTTFGKYSGKKSPSECGPAEFLATQLKLLGEMQSFVQAML
jgi:hypothetical protein